VGRQGAEPEAVVACFFAREGAETGPGDEERLAGDDADLLLEDGEDEEHLDRLHLELRVRPAPADAPDASPVIESVGAPTWAASFRADSALTAMLAGRVADIRFTQGPAA
jgi:hypothetical protein